MKSCMERVFNIILSEEDREKIRNLKKMLEEVVETLDILLDEETLKAILEAEQDIREGKVRRIEEFLNEIKNTT